MPEVISIGKTDFQLGVWLMEIAFCFVFSGIGAILGTLALYRGSSH